MKPLNLDNRPCSPISSNCVIWQGPDIPCIKLCTGDTISDVVFKLATELCTIMDQLKVSNYDLTCLNLNACPPDDFQALIQLLIDKVCELNGIPTGTEKSAGCPDCVISVAQCLKEADPSLPATMQLIDYVQMLAGKICSILSDINIINSQITNLDNRVTILENTPPPTFTLPSIDTSCLAAYIPGAPAAATIDLVLDALVNNDIIGYCELINATGFPDQLLQAVATQCIENTSLSLASKGAGDSPVKTMSAQYGPYSGFGTWNSSPVTVADAINNIWISICDIYSYVSTFSKTVVAAGSGVTVTSSTVSNTITYTVAVAPSVPTVQDTTTINLTNTSGTLSADVQDTGWVDLLGFSYMAGHTNGKPQCRRIGNQVVFRGVIQIPMGNAGNGASGTVNSVTSGDAYNGLMYGYTYDSALTASTDACLIDYPPTGVNINEGRSLQFYRGQRVIPSTILPVGVNFDRSYGFGNRQFIFRGINISDSGVFLSSIINVFVTEDGELGITAPYSVENYTGTYKDYSSMQRNVVSNIIAGEKVPLYNPAAPSINNASAAVTYNADIVGSTLTWPFTMNCMSAAQLGGFSVRLDGLVAYISPCVTTVPTIPTPTPVC